MLYIKALRRSALDALIRAMRSGDTPDTIARMIFLLPWEIQPSIARMIEDAALPGTFAEAVFNILSA